MSGAAQACIPADLLCREAVCYDAEVRARAGEKVGAVQGQKQCYHMPACLQGGAAMDYSASTSPCSPYITGSATTAASDSSCSTQDRHQDPVRAGGVITPTSLSAGDLQRRQWRSSDSINWMMRAAWQLRLESDCIFLAVGYLDRYALATNSGTRSNLTVAAACLWLASKFSDVVVPRAACLVQLSGATFTPEQLVAAEAAVLRALEYRLAAVPTLEALLDQVFVSSKALLAASPQTANMAYYLAELSLMEDQLRLGVPLATLAATCLTMAAALLGHPLPPLQLQQLLGGGDLAALKGCAELLAAVHATVSAAHTISGRPYFVTAKYLHPNYGSVAAVPPLWATADARVTTSTSTAGEAASAAPATTTATAGVRCSEQLRTPGGCWAVQAGPGDVLCPS